MRRTGNRPFPSPQAWGEGARRAEEGPPATTERHRLALLLAIVALSTLPYLVMGYALDDEMLFMSDGWRIASGQVIYRDFYEFAAPLPAWLAAAVFTVTGPRVLGARLLQALFLLLASALAYRLARRAGVGPWLSMAPPLLLAIALARLQPGYNQHVLVWPCLFGAMAATTQGLDTGRLRAWALAGTLSGLGLLMIQSDGLVLVALGLASAIGGGWLAGAGGRAIAARTAAWLAGWSLPVGVAAAILAWQQALGPAIDQIWTWTLTHYHTPGGINDVKYGTDLVAWLTPVPADPLGLLGWYGTLYHWVVILAIGPLMATLAGAWLAGAIWARWRHDTRQAGPEVVLALACLGFFALALRSRGDSVHVGLYTAPTLLVATVAASRLRAALTGPMREFPIALLVLFGLTAIGQQVDMARHSPSQWLVLADPDPRLRASPALDWLQAHAKPGDRQVAVPAGGFWYFYGLPPATRYTYMFGPDAKYYTPEEIWAFWMEVRRTTPRFLVVDPSNEPFLKTAFPGPPRDYTLVATFPSSRYVGTPVYIYEHDPGIVIEMPPQYLYTDTEEWDLR